MSGRVLMLVAVAVIFYFVGAKFPAIAARLGV